MNGLRDKYVDKKPEYAAKGLPVVASQVMHYKPLVGCMDGLTYANNTVKDEWVGAPLFYLNKKSCSEELGLTNRQCVFSQFGIMSLK